MYLKFTIDPRLTQINIGVKMLLVFYLLFQDYQKLFLLAFASSQKLVARSQSPPNTPQTIFSAPIPRLRK